MDRMAVHHLLLNAGSLAEHALVLALQNMPDPPAAEAGPSAPEPRPDSVVPPSPDGLDWGALDGLSLGRSEAACPLPPMDEDDEAERAELSLLCALGPPGVYEAAAPFAARLDRVLARADPARLGALLAALPADPAPLTGRLSAADFARWCSRLAAGAGPLDELVAELRGLDPPL